MPVTYPDLHALLARFGRFDLIPAEAWAEHDRAAEAYHAARRRALAAEKKGKRQ